MKGRAMIAAVAVAIVVVALAGWMFQGARWALSAPLSAR
jgi:hypothetical protein